ncbi:HlyD family efflux transporter periplasmic adaptor subunit [Dickeya chrysanthemi]|uniref:HlyD family secretion protein n=1 Tax=Dickeya chrysanthemi TaxID=556 RepID=UPI0025A10BB8|nr:HlyD family efflux transporter periplasmic adaptor subunit [Dickeya chrysanthemi]WJM83769.1 HlyD family efflux transporter periplasmic adaptor subunit [Dickeya chrysanthemi]
MINLKTRKQRLLAIGALVLTLFVAAVSFRHADTGAADGVQAQWVRIEPQLLENQLGLVGQIQATTRMTLSAPFEGVVREVRVREGQHVGKDHILLSLDPALLEIQMRQAQADVLKAQREVQQYRQWEKGAEVSRARRAVANARQELSNTEANLRDTQTLFARGIVARMEVDSLTQQVRTQRQDLLTAQEELATVLARGQGEERKIAEMELLNAQARYQALEAMYAHRDITAPVAGFVVRPATPENSRTVMVQPGVQVTQGTPLLTLIGQDRLQVLARVEETDLHLLQEGMPVQITGDGFAGQELAGHIAAIAVQGSETDGQSAGARYDVVVSVDSDLSDVKPAIRFGMSARLAVILYRNEQGIAVVPEAIQTDEHGQTYVFYRPTPEAPVSRVPVTPGRSVVQGVEVQGLQAGYVQVFSR